MDALIAHYDEVGLKGGNRHRFEDQLMANLKRALRTTGYRGVRCNLGRITVDFKPPGLVSEAAARAVFVFGIANVGAGLRVEP
ncbi:MAG: tRNA 4-thiouridine(8) synthase ThiI, partial [Actinomycetota bacterium]|nr:tRNA 4-thiouridine(8) synthase ThiI [Actinomycetota bacterium]